MQSKQEYAKLIASKKEAPKPKSKFDENDLAACRFNNNLFKSIDNLKSEYMRYRNSPDKNQECLGKWAGRINEYSENLYTELNNMASEISSLNLAAEKLKIILIMKF